VANPNRNTARTAMIANFEADERLSKHILFTLSLRVSRAPNVHLQQSSEQKEDCRSSSLAGVHAVCSNVTLSSFIVNFNSNTCNAGIRNIELHSSMGREGVSVKPILFDTADDENLGRPVASPSADYLFARGSKPPSVLGGTMFFIRR
jgi:hypothetical protein